jgi:hypothetical protein
VPDAVETVDVSSSEAVEVVVLGVVFVGTGNSPARVGVVVVVLLLRVEVVWPANAANPAIAQ